MGLWQGFDFIGEVGISTNRRAARQSSTNSKAPSLLAGLVYDETAEYFCPTHASKKAKRYRYYISKRLMHRAAETHDGWRVPARELPHPAGG